MVHFTVVQHHDISEPDEQKNGTASDKRIQVANRRK